MNPIASKTAILFFSRTAASEAKAKSFRRGIGVKGNEKIAKRLIDKTLSTARKTGLPVYFHSEAEQVGTTFGERMANAFNSIYRKGFDNVIAIGNDSPGLTTSILLEAANELQKNPIVLGPSKDGGFFMMAMHKSAFNKSVFASLPWETDQLQSSFANLVNSFTLEAVWFKEMDDIDHENDLKSYIYNNRFSAMALVIQSILSSFNPSQHFRGFIKLQYLERAVAGMRAPPY